jgi:nucleotide-binding universal stress UspA family protein
MDGRSGASPTSRAGEIVVGVDGSPGSLAALRWAIREGYVRGMREHAVTAWEFPVASTFGDMATVGDFHPVSAAGEILLAALADAGVAGDDETGDHGAGGGAPAEVLMKKAEGAELLVVGSRGYGRIFGALLGSVSQYVAARAPRPVVVIRTATTRTSRDLGPDADGNAP